MTEPLDRLLGSQSERGAFPSRVEGGGGTIADETCFVTAQVALILADLRARGAAAPALDASLERALDFVAACACPQVPGAYLFYPPALPGPRLPIGLPPDADDSALAWLALIRGGRRTRAEARAVLPELFARVSGGGARHGDPAWVRAGVRRTWLTGAGGPADIGVNANILAALAEAGCAPGADDLRACAAIGAACALVEPDRSALRALAPFYAHPAEVAIALERAVEAGMDALAPAAARLACHEAADRAAGRPPDRPLYCNAHGRPLWRSPALQLARRLLDQAAPSRATRIPTLNRGRPPCPSCSIPLL